MDAKSETKTHWEEVYRSKSPTEVSWYQPHPETSLALIERTGIGKAAQMIDVGGGTSTLVDDLLVRGYQNVTVLDISSTALSQAKARLSERAAQVTWLEADITEAPLPRGFYDVWHDRAVFHFLTRPEDRRKYGQAVSRSVKAGGYLIMAAFALDGPSRCSGLAVARYSPERLQKELGDAFEFITSVKEDHHTPFGTEQRFLYCTYRKR